MSERRFTDKPELNPQAVRSLAGDHPAMVGNRTLFPSTVVEVTADNPERILISGRDNRKIGATVEKGKFKGYSIFCLSLEERATCPSDCTIRGACYGNGMQLARRNRIGDPDIFYDRLGLEIVQLLDDHQGLLIRLHVLGDFPSVEYVSFWKEVLDEYPEVAVFGYTHRSPTSWGGDEIGDAIHAVKDAHPDRFRIRWSSDVARQDGAVIIDHVPDKPRTANNELVCPAQTDATACCATCGLCWAKEFTKECIAFIKHGPKSDAAHAEAVRAESDVERFNTELVAILPALRRFALSLCRNETKADDLAQEAIAKALSNRSKFAIDTNLKAWVFTILRNEFLTGMRKAGREIDDPEGFLTARLVSTDDQSGSVEAREALAALDLLPEAQREALRDTGLGLTIRQIADKHGVPEGTIKSRVSRGRDMLSDAIANPPPKPRILADLASVEPMIIPAPSIVPALDRRRIKAITFPTVKPAVVPMADMPEIRQVKPTDLIVEESYQRELSGKSIGLIKKIVAGWDWAKYKCPVCAESDDGLFVIDGQHTAIAAASHPHIVTIPVMVVKRDIVAHRADAFVSQNTARLAMSPLQIFHAEVVAGKKSAVEILKCAIRAGANIPKYVPAKGKGKPGEVVSMSGLHHVWKHGKPEHFERVLRIAVLSGKTMNTTLIRGIDLALLETEPYNEDLCPLSELTDAEIAWHVGRLDVERQAAEVAAESECSRYDALAALIMCTLWDNSEEYDDLVLRPKREAADAPIALTS